MSPDDKAPAVPAESPELQGPAAAPTWWVRPGLEPRAGRLCVAGRDAEGLAREHGTPLFAFDLSDISDRVRRVQAALEAAGLSYRVRFALKAQREPEVLSMLRRLGEPGTRRSVGVDVSSPGEVAWALEHGWQAEELSFTGTNLVDRDLLDVLQHPVKLNVDLLSQLRRVGRLAPGRRIGLRLNPRAGAARIFVPAGRSPDDELQFGIYASEKPTKFGIYPERLDEALAVARSYDLTIDTVHFHVSHHLLTDDLPAFERAVSAAAAMARRVIDAGCPVVEVNAGGGLAAVMQQGQEPLDLDAYAGVLAEHLGPLGVTIACEPGEMFAKNAGVLLAEVVTVEDRSRAGDGSAVFAGLTCGWNVMHLAFVYHEFVETVLCRAADAPRTAVYTLASHINEGPDLFAEDYPLPPLEEGDIVALLGVGAYCQANWHPHCLRPFPGVLWYEDRLPG